MGTACCASEKQTEGINQGEITAQPAQYPVQSPKKALNPGEIRYEAETLRGAENESAVAESIQNSVLPTPRNEELDPSSISPYNAR